MAAQLTRYLSKKTFFSRPARYNNGMNRAPFIFAILLTSCFATAATRADDGWPLETLTRNDGKVFRGLLADATKEPWQFVEVVRPPGEPMYLVVHYYPASAVKSIERLSVPQQQQLRDRIDPLWKLKSRRRIEMGRMEDVALIRDGERFISNTPWFTLISSTDEEHTRRCVVRVEQMFRAFETFFPQRTENPKKVTIEIFGSRNDYRSELARRELDLKHAAIYLPREVRILAGADLRAYARRLTAIRNENRELLSRYESLNRALPSRLNELAERLAKTGHSREEVRSEIAVRRAAWREEYESMQSQIAVTQRRNEALFAEVTDAMFARLFHEAFHAWLENAVFTGDQFDSPRWLHEGLAQIFEGGQLEGGVLRLDAPDPARAKQLRKAIATGQALSLRRIIEATPSQFLANHRGDMMSNQLYLHSWGLAWRLFFADEPIDSTELEKYAAAQEAEPITRFESLVGESLERYQERWLTDWQ